MLVRLLTGHHTRPDSFWENESVHFEELGLPRNGRWDLVKWALVEQATLETAFHCESSIASAIFGVSQNLERQNKMVYCLNFWLHLPKAWGKKATILWQKPFQGHPLVIKRGWLENASSCRVSDSGALTTILDLGDRMVMSYSTSPRPQLTASVKCSQDFCHRTFSKLVWSFWSYSKTKKNVFLTNHNSPIILPYYQVIN